MYGEAEADDVESVSTERVGEGKLETVKPQPDPAATLPEEFGDIDNDERCSLSVLVPRGRETAHFEGRVVISFGDRDRAAGAVRGTAMVGAAAGYYIWRD